MALACNQAKLIVTSDNSVVYDQDQPRGLDPVVARAQQLHPVELEASLSLLLLLVQHGWILCVSLTSQVS
jgi:hypothetical protein